MNLLIILFGRQIIDNNLNVKWLMETLKCLVFILVYVIIRIYFYFK